MPTRNQLHLSRVQAASPRLRSNRSWQDVLHDRLDAARNTEQVRRLVASLGPDIKALTYLAGSLKHSPARRVDSRKALARLRVIDRALPKKGPVRQAFNVLSLELSRTTVAAQIALEQLASRVNRLTDRGALSLIIRFSRNKEAVGIAAAILDGVTEPLG